VFSYLITIQQMPDYATARTFKLKQAKLFENRQQPWRDSSFSCPVPSMMCPDELQFLHYMAAKQYTGAGAILDFGPRAGASTFCLASGLGTTGHVFSYDMWHFFSQWQCFFPGQILQEGDDIFPHFERYVAPYRQRITPCKGDLSKQRWSGEPIEMIFIDAAKSPQAMQHIVNEFFPHLIPGGYVFHQDYISSECPWIHISIGLLSGYFEHCDSPQGGTVCLQLTKPIPSGFLAPDFFEAMPMDAGRQAIAKARDPLVDWFALCVWLAEAHYLVHRRQLDKAAAILEKVLADPAFTDSVQYDVDLVSYVMSR